MADRFEDERGIIQDLPIPAPIDAVTRIFTRQGAVRGNHVHNRTIQWTYILSGLLLVATRPYTAFDGTVYPDTGKRTCGVGVILTDEPGVAHAWKALMDTEVLVFTRGPRSGENYKQDTFRLEVPLL